MMKVSQHIPATSAPAPAFIGVDVPPKRLDAVAHGSASVHRFANTQAGVAQWLRTLPCGAVVALKSTGRYHERLAVAAHTKNLVVYMLNPRDVRHYARAMSKTDRLDAQILARYAAHELAQNGCAERTGTKTRARGLRPVQVESACRRDQNRAGMKKIDGNHRASARTVCSVAIQVSFNSQHRTTL
jgi:transposase